MRLLFVENDCSFSWNIVERLPVPREQVSFVRGGDHRRLLSALDQARALLVGSGPLDPVRADLVGVVRAAAERGLPVLGICLGHQAIGLAHGARLVRTRPAHGVRATVHFAPSRLLPGVEGPVEVMRYHSLSLDEVAPPLRVTARHDGIVMAVEHESRPILGLQFHPDSFGTPRGPELLRAFFAATGLL